jgi:bud site selection protein 20
MRLAHKRSKRSAVKDIDQIKAQLKDPRTVADLKNQPLDEHLPGLGQHYCIECAQYYADEASLKVCTSMRVECMLTIQGHLRGTRHKKRVKLLQEVPYSHEEADLAAGIRPARSVRPPRQARTGKDTVMAQ